jgi:hypothetical protein
MTVPATETLTAEQIAAREQVDAFNAFKASHQYFDLTLLKQIGAQPK